MSGIVHDQGGSPLVGVTVAVFDAQTDSDEPLRNARTDGEGRFTVAVAPGHYLLRAVASGFSAVEARALVAPNRETVIDTIALRRVDTLSDRRRMQTDAYRRVVRASKGSVFNVGQDPEDAQARIDAQALADTESKNSTHGIVQFTAASGDYESTSTNFAVTQRALGSDLTVTGQLGTGESAPRRIEIRADKDVSENHEISATFAYGSLGPSRGAETLHLGQYTLQVTDRWQIAGPLVLVYGANYTKFSGASEASAVLPRFGVELSPSAQTQVFARLTPGSSLSEVSSFDIETGRITFTEPQTAPGAVSGARPDRSRRFEMGIGHLVDEHSNVEVMAFFDTASGRPVGLLALPPSGGAEFTTRELDGRSSGVRVLYTRRLSSSVTATVGYAGGTGQRLAASDAVDPLAGFRPSRFNVVAAKVDAELESGMRVSAIYRFAPGAVVFAIDPFAGRLAAFEPSLGVFVAQPIPSFGFIPGQWEATLDVRNIFDARTPADGTDLVLADSGRLVRAGLSLRF